jgi:hypothetical protein
MIITCGCGEYHPSAILRSKAICGNCNARNRGWPSIRRCERCDKMEPCEEDHINGPFVRARAHLRALDQTIVLCVNCHLIRHALKRANRV